MSDTTAHATRTGLHRPEPATIDVDGRPVAAYPGESVATALLANGRTTGGARAPYCNMGVCFACTVTVDDQPHQRACLIRVRPGMRVRTGTGR